MPLPTGWRLAPGGQQAEGGQAHVFRVTRAGDDQVYALKRLKNHENPERLGRFVREVQTMRELRNAGLRVIPEVVEANLEARPPWFVMPWFSGGSLQDAIDAHEFADPPEATDLLIRIGQAIAQLHGAKIAHRDIKPPNIFGSGDEVVLGDFGLCLPVEDAGRMTEHDKVVGSRLYVAPENASGVNEDLDQRPADAYAFGKVIWATFAQRRPFDRERHREAGWRLSEIRGDDRFDSLSGLLDRLLTPEPRRRLTDWIVILGELELFRHRLSGSQLPAAAAAASPGGAVERARDLALRADALGISARRSVEDEVRRWRSSALEPALQAGVRRVDVQVKDILEAANEELRGGIANYGINFPIGNVFVLWPHLRVDTFDERVQVIPGPECTLVDREGNAPTLRVMLITCIQDTQIWIFRGPAIEGAMLNSSSKWIALASEGRLGPLAAGLEASRLQAEQFGAEAGTLFLELADLYIQRVASGADPTDPRSWQLTGETPKPPSGGGMRPGELPQVNPRLKGVVRATYSSGYLSGVMVEAFDEYGSQVSASYHYVLTINGSASGPIESCCTPLSIGMGGAAKGTGWSISGWVRWENQIAPLSGTGVAP
jgi:tRNA A-37 threonylcarbamoyl transferase component Bud32